MGEEEPSITASAVREVPMDRQIMVVALGGIYASMPKEMGVGEDIRRFDRFSKSVDRLAA